MQLLLPALALMLLGTTASRADPAVIYDLGSKYDHSFNEAVFNGAKSWVAKNGGSFAEFEISNETQREQAIRSEAEAGHNPVIVVGFAFEDALSTVSEEFPDSHFVILDDELDKPNVQSVVFKAEEGSFLVGALAAMASKSNVISFVGGMDIPLIRSYSCGYKQGANFINPKIQVIENMTGTTPEAWNDPTKGGELARSQFDRGADVVYAAAGGTGVGVLQAAADAKKLAIGVDSNQNGLHPGSVLTSMVNRLDVATYDAFDDAKNGSWKPGVKVMGLADKGVDWALDDDNAKLVTPEMKAKVEAARDQIISGKITVTDYVKTNSCPN
ncbi:BMP family ABC transporter substrate-binding protein [Labrys miyagiensis]|uniref:BMP family ABC transporter substrate-binding protein n=1 Tax=Labrys miyagiensis TaxID=346912 RepID=A0ABQ6CR69_9HYPH|nr:BMP family ABC transporter substrate-binding protein [Labrys miyagiensis]